MKTKEELLKIFSAYLPYDLNCICTDSELSNGWDKYSSYREGFIFEMDNQDLETEITIHFKPILYSMDMLTKEIEHKGEKFIAAEFVFGKNHNIREVIDEYIINKKGYSFTAIKLPYLQVQKLLELHFNVFNLDESEYIKKETLK